MINSALMLLLCRTDKRLLLSHVEIEEQRSTGDVERKRVILYFHSQMSDMGKIFFELT